MKNVNLLWTGGWDSTFQLLQLLLLYKSPVTPHYLIHAKRNSSKEEMIAMEEIREFLFKNYPFTRELLKPTKFSIVEDIAPDENIDTAYNKILKNKHIGMQYEWIARYCKEHGITDIQLSIEKAHKPKVDHFMYRIIDKLSKTTINSQTVFRIKEEFSKDDIYQITQNFYFPIINITKAGMKAVVIENGWMDIMNMTWFCYAPTSRNKPCGLCTPCVQLAKEGFSWRIPIERRALLSLHKKLLWPLRTSLIKFGLYQKQGATS